MPIFGVTNFCWIRKFLISVKILHPHQNVVHFTIGLHSAPWKCTYKSSWMSWLQEYPISITKHMKLCLKSMWLGNLDLFLFTYPLLPTSIGLKLCISPPAKKSVLESLDEPDMISRTSAEDGEEEAKENQNNERLSSPLPPRRSNVSLLLYITLVSYYSHFQNYTELSQRFSMSRKCMTCLCHSLDEVSTFCNWLQVQSLLVAVLCNDSLVCNMYILNWKNTWVTYV